MASRTEGRRGLAARAAAAWDGDVAASLRASPLSAAGALVALAFCVAALLAPAVAPHTPFDIATVSLADSLLPPAWAEGGRWEYPLGTDDQGRDVFSTIVYGSRISLMVGFGSVLLAMALGVAVGVVAGYAGGWFDAVAMRLADVQLTIPSILLALLVNGVANVLVPPTVRQDAALLVLVFSIGISNWPQYARVARGSTLVERGKEYVQAARLLGVSPAGILLRHILPNIAGPILVVATLGLGFGILAEAALSFLGVGMPPTTPSMGTLIRIGYDYVFSGEWWIAFMPGAALVLLVFSVTLVGDWMRDALNPKLRRG